MKKTIAAFLIGFGIITGLVTPILSYADTAPGASFAHLRLGSHGANVTALQQFLATDPSIYPEGLVTGYYGSLTVKAVKRLQLKYGLYQTGAVGPLTLARLQMLLTPVQTIIPTTTPVTPVTTPTTTLATTTPSSPSTGQATTTPVATTTPASTDTTPPGISYITVSTPSSQSTSVITVTWSTSEMATTKIYFSTATPLDVATASSTSVDGLSYQHSVTIRGLNYNTGYNFVIEAADAAGNIARSQSQTFHTTD